MKNPNTPINKIKLGLKARWSAEDYPGAEPRFRPSLLAKDVAIFFLLPIFAIVLFKSCENSANGTRPVNKRRAQSDSSTPEGSKSQIINFVATGRSSTKYPGIVKRSPGSLVKVKLLNVVETYSGAPVHAQIIDGGLGKNLIGGTLIGDATPDTNFGRVNIVFRYVKHPFNSGVAVPISARALSLDGTLGLLARKKEGYFARAAIGGSQGAAGGAGSPKKASSLKDAILNALSAGLVNEFSKDAMVEKNRSQVLVLQSSTSFFVELTDFFPGAG